MEKNNTVTTQQIAEWIGSDNLNVDSLLGLLSEIANNKYSSEQFFNDVKDYNSDS